MENCERDSTATWLAHDSSRFINAPPRDGPWCKGTTKNAHRHCEALWWRTMISNLFFGQSGGMAAGMALLEPCPAFKGGDWEWIVEKCAMVDWHLQLVLLQHRRKRQLVLWVGAVQCTGHFNAMRFNHCSRLDLTDSGGFSALLACVWASVV